MVLLTYVVDAGTPFQFTTEVFRKFAPFTVRVNAAPPTIALVGEMEAAVGLALSMVKVVALDVPPPGPCVSTATGTAAAVVTSDAEIDAVTLALLTNVVVSAEPFQFMADAVFTKLEPFTVSTNVALPAVLLTGEIVVMAGVGLSIVKVSAFEVPPPGAGFETVTLTAPAVAMSVERIAAVTSVEFTKVVVRDEPPHLTVAPLIKLLPFTVSVNAEPPAFALVGVSDDAEGAGLVTVNVSAFDGAMPGLTTVTWSVPPAAMSPAGTVAVTSTSLTNVVARSAPFHSTTEVEVKPVPFTVSVKIGPPAAALDGEIDVIAGRFSTDATLVLHMLRPWVAAHKICDWAWNASPRTATRGRPVTRVAQLAPEFVV